MNRRSLFLCSIAIITWGSSSAFASVGTEGAAFLEIPVGAEPAALGSAYTALATNAYAPVWNPAGLGFADATSMAAQHLSFLDSINDEFLSFIHPLDASHDGDTHRGIGASIQYLGSGNITRTDIDPATQGYTAPGGSYSDHYGSYNLSYGQTIGEKASWGVTGKWINAQLDNVTANAYAADIGGLYRATSKLDLAATVVNLGTRLKFLDAGDPLPLEFHAAAAWQVRPSWLVSAESVYAKTGQLSGRFGMEWSPFDAVALRVGYRTDTLSGLDALAGLTAGAGLRVWGQEFSYAWVPYGDLGNTQYFSFLLRFGGRDLEKRNLIRYQKVQAQDNSTVSLKLGDEPSDSDQLRALLSYEETHVAKNTSTPDEQ